MKILYLYVKSFILGHIFIVSGYIFVVIQYYFQDIYLNGIFIYVCVEDPGKCDPVIKECKNDQVYLALVNG